MVIVQATGDRSWQLIYLNCDEGSISRSPLNDWQVLVNHFQLCVCWCLLVNLWKDHVVQEMVTRQGPIKKLGLPSLSVRSSRLRWPCYDIEPEKMSKFHLSPVYTNSGASNFCHKWPILPGCLSNFARLSDQFWDRNFPISPSDFVQCDVRLSDAYKNQTDCLAKLVGQQKLGRFWLFCVNYPLTILIETDIRVQGLHHRHLKIAGFSD
jgi:hypothetical protein